MTTPLSWTGDLACPVCHQALHFDREWVRCTGCGRSYPIVDDIPVLIPERALPPAPDGSGSAGQDSTGSESTGNDGL
ncbi:MAG TPA: Trm112 family protein [Terracidiphilus sp.]|nr:Trm112 family protein [Terracidiphilus sp.]